VAIKQIALPIGNSTLAFGIRKHPRVFIESAVKIDNKRKRILKGVGKDLQRLKISFL